MWLYYFFAALIVWQGVVSLRGGAAYLAYVKRALAEIPPDYAPAVTVFAPCRGLDQTLAENLRALFEQRYPDYELIFVVDRESDPALAVIEDLRRAHAGGPVPARVIVAGPARDSGQKVHNLLQAVPRARESSEVFVFVDSDARPHPTWIRDLVAPLGDESVGAATGYRWFVPARRSVTSLLRATWNASIASALGVNDKRNFCWGGSTAIRRRTFERSGVAERWRGALSDDFALTGAVKEARLSVRFVPRCLVASIEDVRSWRDLFEFTTRQIKITRVYAPHLYHIVLWSNLVFVAVFFGGLSGAARRAARGDTSAAWPLAIVCLIFALGAAKALIRLRAVELMLPGYKAQLRRARFAHAVLWPLSAALYAHNAIAASFSRRIEWRGIAYELKSPRETVIIGHGAADDSSPTA